MMKRATHKVEWVIPALARAARIQGTVVVQVFVGPNGEVDCVNVVSGHPMFIGSVVDAVRQWKFLPAKQDGKPVGYSGTLTFALSWSKSMSLLDQ
jgi:protein TonB